MWGRTKYGNKKTNGRASKFENAVYEILKEREAAGEIRDIKEQCPVVLQGGKRVTRIAWKIDFSFIECYSGELVYAEAKGFETDVYRIKLKMFRFNPPAKLEIYKGHYSDPKLVETIYKKENS